MMDPKLGRTIVLAVACGCLALFGTALAQQQSQQGNQQQGSQQQSDQQQKSDQQKSDQQKSNQDSKKGSASGGATAPVAGVMKLGTTVIETEAIAKGYRASRLIGKAVKNDQGERVGKVEDMIVSPDGKVTMAIVEVGGFLGIGDRRVAIPVDQFTALAPDIVLPGATKTALKELPEFKYSRA